MKYNLPQDSLTKADVAFHFSPFYPVDYSLGIFSIFPIKIHYNECLRYTQPLRYVRHVCASAAMLVYPATWK